MTIERLFNKNFDVKRQVKSGDKSNEQVVATIEGHIQPAGGKLQENFANRFSFTHTLWCKNGADIKTGDVVEEKDTTKEYNVRGVEEWDVPTSSNKHQQVFIEQG